MTPKTLPCTWLHGARDGKIPVLFLHGFMGSASDWSFLSTGFSHPSIAIDLPAHGASSFSLQGSNWFAETSHMLQDTLESLNLPKVTLAGYSLGGRVVMDFASRYPKMVHQIVLESSHPGLSTEADQLKRILHDKEWAGRIKSNWPAVLQAWYKQPVFQNTTSQYKTVNLDGLIAARSRGNPQLLAAALEGFSLGNQLEWDPKDLRCLYIAGLLDSKYVDLATVLEAKSSSVLLKLVEGAGHNVHLERPDQYLALLTQFLESDLP